MVLFQTTFANNNTITLKVGVYENEPKIFTTDSGKPSGIFIDIIEYIAKKEGWKLIYKKGTWDEGLNRLNKGEIDLMPDVAFTDEREKLYVFHKEPVLSSWSQVYAAKSSQIKEIWDLRKKRIAVLKGSVQQRIFESLINGFGIEAFIVPFDTFEEAFDAVAKGKADAVVTNNLHGLLQTRRLGLENTSIVFNPSSLFFAGKKGIEPSIMKAIDKRLIEMKKNPKSIYYSSIKQWTADKVTYALPLWVKLLFLGIIITLTVSIIAIFVFNRLLKSKTSELRKLNQEMEQRILERTWALEEAMEKAKEADMIKSAFLATMSHELRTPLNSIIGFTGILLQGLAGELNEEQRKQLGMVQNSAKHLLSLINDILDISKIEAGQLDLYYEHFDIDKSIDKVIKIIKPLSDKKGLDLQVEFKDYIQTVYADQRRIEQIMINLLSNAVKFTEHGFVRITLSKEDNLCVIAVKDCGIGLKETEIEKIFVPFSQIDTGLTRRYEGTGLGLSICKKLIEMMHGTISVNSKIGRGSTFTIKFPIAKEG